jgi:N-hydroxyarylamine O-acetyltransferase
VSGGPEAQPEHALAPALVEAVLERLGLAQAPDPDLPGLASLYRAWCRRVPFDNVWKRIHLAEGLAGPLPGDAPEDFFASWLRHGTGGTCWAGNGALAALLAALGFRADRVLSTMRVAPDLPPNHGSVCVTIDGARHLVDASMLFDEPLALVPGGTTHVQHPAWGVMARPEGERWAVRWRPLHVEALDCGIDALGATPAQFRERHEATREWSPFNFALSARLDRDDGGVVGVALGQRAEIDAAGRWTVRPFAAGERVGFLIEELGLSEEAATRLPEDAPMPPPPKP